MNMKRPDNLPTFLFEELKKPIRCTLHVSRDHRGNLDASGAVYLEHAKPSSAGVQYSYSACSSYQHIAGGEFLPVTGVTNSGE